MQRQILYIAGMTLALISLIFPALRAETSYPFQRMGVVDNIYATENRLVINDVSYEFSPSTPVYLYRGETDKDQPKQRQYHAHHTLRRGMHVGFTTISGGPTQQQKLVEVWILPPGGLRQPGEQG
jgi:hypothetical protein